MVLTGGSMMGFSPQDTIRWGGNYGPLTLGGEYWRLVTANFVHGSIIHLAFNMWCLWSLGQLSERLFGSWVTFAVYILTGVGGSLLSVGWNPGRFEVGASGAIFGLAGAIVSGIKFGNIAVSSMQKRAILSSMVFFVGFNLFIGLAPGIDNMCHLGGFISGLVFGVPLATAASSGKKSYEWATIVLAALVLAGVGARVVTSKGHVSQLRVAAMQLQDGNYPSAISALERATASDPSDAQAHGLLGYAYEMNHQRDKAIAAYERALQLDPNFTEAKTHMEDLKQQTR
jgi:rhomboid protease GluP